MDTTTFTLQEFQTTDGWIRLYDIVAGGFVWTEESFLSSVSVVITTLIGYLIVCYGLDFLLRLLGVTRSKEGSIWNAMLKLFSIAHNFNMMAISTVCFVGIAIEVAFVFQASEPGMGLYTVICDPEHKHNKGKIIFWIYVYYLSKFVELLDTMLIVLRRSDLRLIHTYHHVATMAITYMGLYFKGTGPWVIILLNTFVHIVMYFYYLLVSLDVRDVWWKNHLTDIQISQFVIDSFFLALFIYWDLRFEAPKGNKCAGSMPGAIVGLVVVVSYFFLFLRLRIANTRKQKKIQAQKEEKKLK